MIACLSALLLLSACGAPGAVQGVIQQHTRCFVTEYAEPRWSPDGQRIAYVMTDNRSSNLLLPVYLNVVDVLSLATTRLGTFADGVEAPTWSPDGQTLAVSVGRGKDIIIVDAATAQATRLNMPPNSIYYDPDWSPDGRRLALTTEWNTYPAISIASLTDAVLSGDAVPPPIEGLSGDSGRIHGFNSRWSPDGERLAFMWLSGPSDYTIYLVNADGSDRTLLVTNSQMLDVFSWSPDGQRIAYSIGSNAGHAIYLIDIASGAKQTVTTEGYSPDLAPDGKRIAFLARDRAGYEEVYMMNLDGSDLTQLTQNPSKGICIH
jgi:Tol biopolymer transport system component